MSSQTPACSFLLPQDDLIPLTVPEVRRLLTRLIWHVPPTPAHTLAWSYWRRRHQARARRCHYQRRARDRTHYLRL